MKTIKTLFFLLLSFNTCFATSADDSIYHSFMRAYKQERLKANFVGAVFEAAVKSTSVEDKIVQQRLHEYNTADTTAMRLLTEMLVKRFVSQDLFAMECNKDNTAFMPFLQAYSNYQCDCVTEKMKTVDKHNSGAYGKVAEDCAAAAQKDETLLSKLRALGLTQVQLEGAQGCFTPYLYANCAYLLQDLVNTAVEQTSSQYYNYKKDKEFSMLETISKHITKRTKGTELSAYFADDKVYKSAIIALKGFSAKLPANADYKKVMTRNSTQGQTTTYTFIYLSKKPFIVGQIQAQKQWKEAGWVMASPNYVPAEKVKNAADLLSPYMGGDEAPPEVRELAR